MSDLSGSAAALRAGDDDAALAGLLAAWDTTRAPEVAEVIGEVSARIERPAILYRPRPAALTAWITLARAGQPGDVGRLLASYAEVAAQEPPHLAVPRLDEMLALRPDPRIARALLASLGSRENASDKTYVRVAKLLARHGAAWLAPELAAALDARTAHYQTFATGGDRARFEKVPTAWAKRKALAPPTGLDEIRAALAGPRVIAAPAAPVHRDGPALLAAIFANPADDDARAVYADFLASAGDPRGELIALQLARAQGRGTPAGLAREAALLKAHRTAWLGGLAGELVMGDTIWERGFPVATTTKLATVSAADASLIRPEWATFERIAFSGAALITPVMRALVEVRGLTVSAANKLAKLAAPPPRLASVGLDLEYTSVHPLDLPAVQAVLAVPTLRAFALDVRWPEATAADLQRLHAGVAGRLEALTITGGGAFGEAMAPLLAPGVDHGSLRALGWGGRGTLLATARRAVGEPWSVLELDVRPGYGATDVYDRMFATVRPGTFPLARVTSSVATVADAVVSAIVARVAGVAARVERVPPPALP